MTHLDLESREAADVSEGDELEIVYEFDGEEKSATVTVVDTSGKRPTVQTESGNNYILHTINTSYDSPRIIPRGERRGFDLVSAERIN